MPITKNDILKVAALARLDLTPEELDRFSKDLAQILTYVEQIQKVDTEGIVPQSQFIKAENVFRSDSIRPSLPRSEALANAPDRDEEYFRVPRVLG